MKLKFVCPENFEIANDIGSRIQEYLPNLIYDIEIIRTDAFKRIYQAWDILPKVERIVEPDWDNDIAFVVIPGLLYFADMELYEAGATLGKLRLRNNGTTRPFSYPPKLGGEFHPRNMYKELRGDIEYWAKLGVEEILHYFSVPKQHDGNCFFHPKQPEKITVEDRRKNYCPKCQEFMVQLEDPLEWNKLLAKVEEIYKLKPRSKPRSRWRQIVKKLISQAQRS